MPCFKGRLLYNNEYQMRFLTGGYMLEQRKFMGARLPPKECTKMIPRGKFWNHESACL
jgi:hypothetical protein